MHTAEDTQILQFARDTDRICITLDHDFHSHLALTGTGRPSVVLLRVQGLDAQAQAVLVRSIWDQCESVLAEGAAVSADRTAIRIRRLPLRTTGETES
jgi:predicted nuclease of predicted toxin-antitoxin system